MTAYAPDDVLLAITQATKAELSAWRRGVYLEASTGRAIEDLRQRAVGDRIALAAEFRMSARACMSDEMRAYRTAVSRFYYSMYHAGRAVVYFQKDGDDHEEHSKLPTHLPGDFPERNRCLNAITNARLDRNRADYEPYPKSQNAWRSMARQWESVSTEFLAMCRVYLRQKGCRHV